MSETIYVVVYVSYDYYRFQDNIGAATNIETARTIAKDYQASGTHRGDLPIIEDGNVSKSMDHPETFHIWIESWPKPSTEGQ